MAERRFFWLKLKNTFFNQKSIKKLRKVAGGDTFTIIYLEMMLKSVENDGILYFEHYEEDFTNELALDLDEDVDNVKMTLAFLQANGLIEQGETDSYELPEAKTCIGSECASAKRVREHRERLRTLQSNDRLLHSNTPVTNCNVEKEIEKRESKRKSREEKTLTPFELVEDEALREALLEYRNMRKENKSKLTLHAEKLALSSLRKLTHDLDEAVEIVNQSTVSGWKGFFPVKEHERRKSANSKINELMDYLSQVEVVDNGNADGLPPDVNL